MTSKCRVTFATLLFLAFLVTGACSPEAEPPAEAPVEPPPVEPAPVAVPAPVEPSPQKQQPPPPTEEPPPVAPPPDAPTAAVVDVGGHVEVDATREGLTRIGAAKCKICHKVQYASWLETAHGTRTPPLDCEDCHGAGSEYKGLKVMKDPEQARAAGLVIPDRAFCSQCHVADWSDDLLQETHEHKRIEPA